MSAYSLSGIDVSANGLCVNGRGGWYVFVARRQGIRPEIKLVGIPGQTFARTSVGVVYQFGE